MTKYNISLIFLLSTLLFSANSIAQQSAVNAFVKMKGLESANLGVNVIDIKTGVSVASFNPDKPLVPASIMKVVTTATALELYGPEYRFITKLGYSGSIDNQGILFGDIYIKGAGDPTLGSEHFERDKDDFLKSCISVILKAGIKRIEGWIIVDETCFDTEGVSGKWLWEDVGNYFASGVYGISIYDNLYRLYLKSGRIGEKPQILRTEPNMPQIGFYNYLETSGSKDSAYIYGMPFVNERWLYGAIPANKTDFFIKGDIPDPPLFLATYLHERLLAAGIQISGMPSSCRLLNMKNEQIAAVNVSLLSYSSPTLAEIIRQTNVKSNNHFAEHLLKLCALTKYKQGTFAKGVEVVQSFWKDKGVDLSGVFMYDGSGLSPADRMVPQVMTAILTYMDNKSKYSSSFYDSLPMAGKEGTVRNLLKGTSLEGDVHLKSGSITNVQCYAGYLDKGNKRYAFCVMANDYGIPRKSLVSAIEKMMLGLF